MIDVVLEPYVLTLNTFYFFYCASCIIYTHVQSKMSISGTGSEADLEGGTGGARPFFAITCFFAIILENYKLLIEVKVAPVVNLKLVFTD